MTTRPALAASVLALMLVLLVLAIRAGTLAVPDRWNPWAPLRVDEPLHWLTRYKLSRLTLDDGLCLRVLEQSGLNYQPLPDRRTAEGCGYTNAVRIEAIRAAIGGPLVLRCRTAVSLALWERHIVGPAARAHFGASLKRLEHLGSYACRNVYGRPDAPLSRHARADAIDVAAFILSDGTRVRVQDHWAGADRRADFLRDVHRGACRVFDGVLGPDYNIAHGDHFHFDRGGVRVCR